MQISWQSIFSTGQPYLDNDIRDLTVSLTQNGPHLLGTTGHHGGLFSVSLAEGAPTLGDVSLFNSAGADAATGSVSVFGYNGSDYVVYGTSGDSHLATAILQEDGTFGSAVSWGGFEGFGTGALAQLVDLAAGQVGLYTIASATGAFLAHDLNATQSQVVHAGLGAGAQLVHAGGQDTSYVVVTDMTTNGLISYRVGTSPDDLTKVAVLGAAQGLSLSTPSVLSTVNAFGADWILVGGAGSHSLAVVRLSATGQMYTTDLVMDTLATRFADIATLKVVSTGAQVLVFAAGSDDGFSVFSLLPTGQLVHRETVVHDTGLGLENVQDIEAVQIGDTLHVFAASTTSDGVAWMTLDVGDFAAATTAAVGAQTLTGGAGDDMLVGSDGGADTLTGGAGSDILVSSTFGGRLTGGAGADTFVIGAADTSVHITDFELGTDRLDLSSLPFLYGPSALGFARSGQDVLLTHRDTFITLSFTVAPVGGAALDDIFPGMVFDVADRVPILFADPGQFAIGGDASEALSGAEFADTLMGGGGNDTLTGNAGPDVLEGGDGQDLIQGGADDDTISGDAGPDSLVGDSGNDSLIGGDGVDTLIGDDGDDTVIGGADGDRLDGGLGDDTLDGQAGSDIIAAGRGTDTVQGGLGDDTIRGDGGNDILYGGVGHDVLRGGRDEDTIYGDDGNDIVRGQRNADTIFGGAGDDNLKGGGGNDWVAGGAGDDFLKGGTRSDHLLGGEGDDVLFANSFSDTLEGGRGDDLLNAGGGDDRVIGGAGRDILKGGAGADRFVFARGMGQDQVLDFTSGLDVLEVAADLLDGATSGVQIVDQFGRIDNGRALLDFGSGDRITLNGVSTLSGLSDDLTIV